MIPTFSIGQRIKDRRKELGRSGQEMADLIGVSVQAFQQWERDETAPKRTRLAAVAEALGVTQNFLLGLGDSAAPTRPTTPSSEGALRDRLAEKALVAIIEKWDGESHGKNACAVLAKVAYRFADAMLAERAK